MHNYFDNNSKSNNKTNYTTDYKKCSYLSKHVVDGVVKLVVSNILRRTLRDERLFKCQEAFCLVVFTRRATGFYRGKRKGW